MTPPLINKNYQGLEQLATAAIVFDKNLKIIYMNPSAEVLLELSHGQAHNQNIEIFFEDHKFFKLALDSATKKQSSYRENEYFIKSKQNKTICVTLTISQLNKDPGDFIVELIQMDQHLRVAKEERMFIQQQANSELLRNLAHEIRNPLGGLRGAAQLLEKELGDHSLEEYTQIIIKEADRLQNLMNKLLTPHQLPAYEETNIHEVIERVRSLILSEFGKDITFVRDYDVSLPEIIADREKLIQAVLNIARNAIQSMQNDNTQNMQLKLTTRSERQIVFHKKKHATAIRIDIEDNGPGIPLNIQDKIFYPLVSGNEQGSGLGLPLSQNIVTQHKGMITFISQTGHTKFSILLPINNGLNDLEANNNE
ncbi:MAG: nitrogen regulation protein NR(II) [Methylophilaceae bacterium]|nr:nitrogen regulation protein NR(II) [Methylophilaceae bacterium]